MEAYYVVKRPSGGSAYAGKDAWVDDLLEAEKFRSLPDAMMAARIASINNSGAMQVIGYEPRMVARVTAGDDSLDEA